MSRQEEVNKAFEQAQTQLEQQKIIEEALSQMLQAKISKVVNEDEENNS